MSDIGGEFNRSTQHLTLEEKMECIARDQWFPRGFTATEKTELWNRWESGGIAESDWASV